LPLIDALPYKYALICTFSPVHCLIRTYMNNRHRHRRTACSTSSLLAAVTFFSLIWKPPTLNIRTVIMASAARSSRTAIKCNYCDITYATTANLGRHIQTSHANESRLIGLSSPATNLVFGTFVGGAPPPALLDPVTAPVPLEERTMQPSLSVAERLEQAALMAATEMDADDALDQPPPLMDDTDEDIDCVLNGPNMEVAASDHQRGLLGDTDVQCGTNSGKGAYDNDVSSSSGMASDGHEVGAAEYGAYDGLGDLLDAGIPALSMCQNEAPMVEHIFLSSTAARIRAYYEAFPEASMAVPVVSASWASRPTRFGSLALRGALRFALTAGGSGLSERDQTQYAATLGLIESEARSGSASAGPFSAAFPSPRSFLYAVRHETNRVLALRRWQKVPISVGTNTYVYYFRDIFQAGLDALAAASHVSFGEATNLSAVNLHSGDDEDNTRVRHGTLDSDLYLGEWRSVRRLHGTDACVMGVQIHADEAIVSWSGACYMFPVRANFVNVLDSGGGWTTVGYIEHIPKAIEKTAAARLAISDARNDLFHRCIAVSTRTLARASETGVSAPVGGHGVMRLVPRVVGLVVDQVEERRFFALMGNQCRFFCSPCMEDRRVNNSLHGIRAVDRDPIATLDAQLAAAVVRETDPRPSRRRGLREEHSALAFAPPLGAIHGLTTGATNLYRIASFDVLHVWKLGILRMLAQRLPAVLEGLCRGRDGARYGSVASTLDAINLRGMQLGRNCKASPAPPGYVCNGVSINLSRN